MSTKPSLQAFAQCRKTEHTRAHTAHITNGSQLERFFVLVSTMFFFGLIAVFIIIAFIFAHRNHEKRLGFNYSIVPDCAIRTYGQNKWHNTRDFET